jgi:hypothetical protein
MSGAGQPTTAIEGMESRVLELELKLAGGATPPVAGVGGLTTTKNDVSSRLDALMRSMSSAPPSSSSSTVAAGGRANAKRAALHEDFRAIDRLMSELDVSPVSSPTAAAGGGGDNSAAPMAYRRMEVLANAESMRRDMEMMARIRDLVAIGTRAAATDGSPSSSSGVVNCPIVTSGRYDLPSDPDAIERLDALCYRAANLCGRVAAASRRADNMLSSYGGIVMALSEKMVLAEEQINDRKIGSG